MKARSVSAVNLLKKINTISVPRLTRTRIIWAISIAVVADALQLLAVPVFVEVVDVVAMILTTWLLGFHLLLLPTFVVEFIPLVDMLPTWTGCVIAVIALRNREQARPNQPPTVVANPDDLKKLPPP